MDGRVNDRVRGGIMFCLSVVHLRDICSVTVILSVLLCLLLYCIVLHCLDVVLLILCSIQ